MYTSNPQTSVYASSSLIHFLPNANVSPLQKQKVINISHYPNHTPYLPKEPRHQLYRHQPSPIYRLKLQFLLSLIIILLPFLVAPEPSINLKFPQPPPHLVPLDALPPHQRRRSVNLEPIHPWHVAFHALRRDQCRIYLEYDIVKGRAEVGAVNSGVAAGFGIVDVFAARAEQFDRLDVGDVA